MKTKRARLNKLVLAACRLTEKKLTKNTTYIAPSLRGASPSPLRFLAWAFLPAAAAILTLLILTASSSFAGSATWLASPTTGDWNTAGNWTAGGPPNGPSDTAFFATSDMTTVSLSANTEVNGTVFNSGGSAFTITASPMFTFTISGVGITNNSGIMQNFVAPVDEASNFGTIAFTNSAAAGSLTAFTINGGAVAGAPGSTMQFFGTSTAGNGTFTVNAAMVDSAGPGTLKFFGTSTAGNGTFTVVGGVFYAGSGGQMGFYDSSTAGNGTFTITVAESPYGGASIGFSDSSTPGNGIFTVNGSNGSTVIANEIYFVNTLGAGNATLIANGGLSGGSGGSIYIPAGLFTGGTTARVEVFGNGNGDYTNGNLNIQVDDGNTHVQGPTIGSIEGNGAV